MATTTPNTASTSKAASDGEDTLVERGRAVMDDVVSAARDSVGDVATRLPDAASATRGVFVEAERQINAGSDEMVAIGAALSFGFAVGLLVGGFNRLIIAVALVPAAFMGGTLVARRTPKR